VLRNVHRGPSFRLRSSIFKEKGEVSHRLNPLNQQVSPDIAVTVWKSDALDNLVECFAGRVSHLRDVALAPLEVLMDGFVMLVEVAPDQPLIHSDDANKDRDDEEQQVHPGCGDFRARRNWCPAFFRG